MRPKTSSSAAQMTNGTDDDPVLARRPVFAAEATAVVGLVAHDTHPAAEVVVGEPAAVVVDATEVGEVVEVEVEMTVEAVVVVVDRTVVVVAARFVVLVATIVVVVTTGVVVVVTTGAATAHVTLAGESAASVVNVSCIDQNFSVAPAVVHAKPIL